LSRHERAAVITLVVVVVGTTATALALRGSNQRAPAALPHRFAPIERFRFDSYVQRIRVGEGAAFTTLGTYEPFELVRIDARTGAVKRMRLEGPAFAFEVGAGAVWIGACVQSDFGCGEPRLLKIDPQTLSVLRDVPMEAQVFDVEAEGNDLWVELAHRRGGTILLMDPQTLEIVARISSPVGQLEVGAGGLWVADLNKGVVFHIDPVTGRELAQVPAPREDPCRIAADADVVWVSSCLGGLDPAIRIDPMTNRVVQTIRLEHVDLEIAEGILLVAVTRLNVLGIEVRRLDRYSGAAEDERIWLARDPDRLRGNDCGVLSFPPDARVTAGEGAIWVTNCTEAQVIRVEP
jgi:hypothetical protein